MIPLYLIALVSFTLGILVSELAYEIEGREAVAIAERTRAESCGDWFARAAIVDLQKRKELMRVC